MQKSTHMPPRHSEIHDACESRHSAADDSDDNGRLNCHSGIAGSGNVKGVQYTQKECFIKLEDFSHFKN